MDKLLYINWEKTRLDETQSFFTQDKFNHSSAAYHHVHGIMQTPWPFTEQNKKHGVDDLDARKWNPVNLKRETIDGPGGQGEVIMVHPPRPLPRKSSLSYTDQRDYFFALLRISKAFLYGTEVIPNDMLRFKELHDMLKEEFKEFQDYAKTMMLQNPAIYKNLGPGVSKYVNEAWQNGLKSVTSYLKYYATQGNLLLIPKENLKVLDIILENNLLDIGKIPSQIFPPVNKVVKLQRTYKALNKRYPIASYQKLNNKVSSDINAVRLASKYEADIVISTETLKRLAGTLPPLFKKSWTIPFTVIQSKANGKSKRVIIFDDPLFPLEMSGYEKNNFFNQLAVKYQFTNHLRARYYRYPGTENNDSIEDEDEDESDDDIFGANKGYSDTIDTFGVEMSASKTANAQNGRTNSDAQANPTTPLNASATSVTAEFEQEDVDDSVDSDSSEGLMIDLDAETPSKKKPNAAKKEEGVRNRKKIDLDGETSGPISSESPSKRKKGEPTKQQESSKGTTEAKTAATQDSNILGAILMEQEKLIQKNPKKASKGNTGNLENPRMYVQPSGNQNFSYKTWLLKGNLKAYRLLVRSSVDTAFFNPNDGIRTFIMTAKSEYQPWFGSECLTPEELFETWIDLYLRPGTRLFRARVDAYTGDFMVAEQKDEACLRKEINFQYGDHLRFEQSLNSIWAVLSSLYEMDLTVGSYLLRHSEKDGVSVEVLCATDEERASFDLHDTFTSINTEETVVKDPNEQWRPLDPFMVLPVHRALERPPVTFEPSGDGKAAKNKKKTPNQKKKQNQAKKKKTPTKK